MTLLSDADVARIRRRSHAVIIAGQALAGIGMGATFSADSAGVVLALIGYAGLSLVATALVAVVLGALAIRTARRPAAAGP
jgi:uncharacterized membrane protein AbrB (regulator of aidB expression)